MEDLFYPLSAVSAILLVASIALIYARTSKREAIKPAVEEIVDERPVVSILYGTQTGTAEKFAKQLASRLTDGYGEATRFLVTDIELYDHAESLAKEKLTFLLLATYGDGEPTDNAMGMHEWVTQMSEDVMNGDQPELYKGGHYAVFGLGNRQYEHFNSVAKQFHKHLGVLGGSPLVPVGLGDDDADLADDFQVWCDKLMVVLDNSGLLTKSVGTLEHAILEGYSVTVLPTDTPVNKSAALTWNPTTNASHNPQMGSIREVRELHSSESDRSCIHVEIDLEGTTFSYEHGDHVAILAQNSSETVDLACSLLGMDPNTMLQVEIPTGNEEMLNKPFPSPVSVHTALTLHTELLQHPDKQALEAMASCCSNEEEAARLKFLASQDGKSEFASYIVNAQRSLLQIMQDFPSCKPSLGLFFAHIAGVMQPRYYSISSSPLRNPTTVHVTAAVVDEVTPNGRRHQGVTTTWLSHLKPGDALPIFIRHSTFKLPKDLTLPIVMIGPGTGLAPFRGFLQERSAQQACGDSVGSSTLFFGCRHPAKDYIYQEEMQASVQDGILAGLFVAFSRLAASKVYVQHHLLTHAAAVYAVLEANGVFYVCGDAKHMAKDVHHALHEVIQTSRQCGKPEAEKYVKALQMSGRYHQDVW